MADHETFRLALTGTQRGRDIEASLSRPRFITYRNCCHLPKFVTQTWRIGYQQASPVLAAPRLPTAVEQLAPCAWSTCTQANPPLSCRGILIRSTYTVGVACLHSLIPKARHITSQHNTTHTHQFILIICELALGTRRFSTTLLTSASHHKSRRVMNRGTTLRRLLTPRSVSSQGCHFRARHVYTTNRLMHGSPKRPHEVLGTAARQPEAEPLPVQRPNDRVTVNDIKERRAKAGKLVAGVAAYCDSDMFKAPVSPIITIHSTAISTKE